MSTGVCARRRVVLHVMGWCTHVLHTYCGPLITIAVGIGFMLVGALPVAVTYATNAHNSAMIIGAGFVGFGLLVVLPGLAWCLVRRVSALRCCRFKQHRFRQPDDDYIADDEGAVVSSGGIQRHLATLSGSVFVVVSSRFVVKIHSAANITNLRVDVSGLVVRVSDS